MLKSLLAAAAVSALLLGASAASAGEQTPTQAWGNVWGPPTSADVNVYLNTAIADELAHHHGYGAAENNAYTTVNETIGSVTNNHYGTENSSSSANINNMNQTSTSNNVGAGSSGVTITATTGSSQTSGTTVQGSSSNAAGNGGISSGVGVNPNANTGTVSPTVGNVGP